jgi:23S rRNA (guanosine2251-2'-O)-methyltransferase
MLIKNPHSIFLTLEKRPDDVKEIYCPKDHTSLLWEKIKKKAALHKIPLLPPPANKKQSFEGRTTNHGALIKPIDAKPLTSLLNNPNGILFACDSIQDPQNLGAIFRCAAFFNIQGIILCMHRATSVNSTVYDVASGGVEVVPFSVAANLTQALEKAKKAGFWILGTSENATQPLETIDKERPWVVVFGNEHQGMRQLIEKTCDVTCKIDPVSSDVQSLNVSITTGIIAHYFKK